MFLPLTTNTILLLLLLLFASVLLTFGGAHIGVCGLLIGEVTLLLVRDLPGYTAVGGVLHVVLNESGLTMAGQ